MLPWYDTPDIDALAQGLVAEFDIDAISVMKTDLPPYIGGLTESSYEMHQDELDIEGIDLYLDEDASGKDAIDTVYRTIDPEAYDRLSAAS